VDFASTENPRTDLFSLTLFLFPLIVLDLDAEPTKELAIHLILHCYNISKVYVNGKLEKEE